MTVIKYCWILFQLFKSVNLDGSNIKSSNGSKHCIPAVSLHPVSAPDGFILLFMLQVYICTNDCTHRGVQILKSKNMMEIYIVGLKNSIFKSTSKCQKHMTGAPLQPAYRCDILKEGRGPVDKNSNQGLKCQGPLHPYRNQIIPWWNGCAPP